MFLPCPFAILQFKIKFITLINISKCIFYKTSMLGVKDGKLEQRINCPFSTIPLGVVLVQSVSERVRNRLTAVMLNLHEEPLSCILVVFL